VGDDFMDSDWRRVGEERGKFRPPLPRIANGDTCEGARAVLPQGIYKLPNSRKQHGAPASGRIHSNTPTPRTRWHATRNR